MAGTQTPIEKLLDLNEQRQPKILVVGDIIQDEYYECSCERISPEAPCPILKVESIFKVPGGAANVTRQLDAWNVDVSGQSLHCNPSVKKRYCVDGRIVFRADMETNPDVPERLRMQLRIACEEEIVSEKIDAVLVSDYAKGTITENLARRLTLLCKNRAIPIIIDSKNNWDWWEGCTVFQIDLARAKAKGKIEIRKEVNCDYVVLTQGARPPIIYGIPGQVYVVNQQGPHIQQARSVSGAGDHFAAILTLCLAHRMDIEEAASLAHESGCFYVTQLYNEPVLPHELLSRFDPVSAKITTAEKLEKILCRKPQRIVFANGIWSIIHAGHLATLEFAKKQGDVLVVAVNSDDSAERIKGKRPVVPDWQRMRVLAGLSCVDFVVMFNHNTPEDIMKVIKPHVLVKGPDNYLNPNIPGRDLVDEVRFAPQTKALQHTSELLEKSYEKR